jgi:hypothetical protein
MFSKMAVNVPADLAPAQVCIDYNSVHKSTPSVCWPVDRQNWKNSIIPS